MNEKLEQILKEITVASLSNKLVIVEDIESKNQYMILMPITKNKVGKYNGSLYKYSDGRLVIFGAKKYISLTNKVYLKTMSEKEMVEEKFNQSRNNEIIKLS